MKVLTREHFFLTWNGHNQPVSGTRKEDLKKYILGDISRNLEPWKVSSNFRKKIKLSEILNP